MSYRLHLRFQQILGQCATQEWACELPDGLFYVIQLWDWSEINQDENETRWTVYVYLVDMFEISRKRWRSIRHTAGFLDDLDPAVKHWGLQREPDATRFYELPRIHRMAEAFDQGDLDKELRWQRDGDKPFELFHAAVMWCQPTPAEVRYQQAV